MATNGFISDRDGRWKLCERILHNGYAGQGVSTGDLQNRILLRGGRGTQKADPKSQAMKTASASGFDGERDVVQMTVRDFGCWQNNEA